MKRRRLRLLPLLLRHRLCRLLQSDWLRRRSNCHPMGFEAAALV